MDLIIHKTVTFHDHPGYGARARCPFCLEPSMRTGLNDVGERFYYCFNCGAAGCAETVKQHEQRCVARQSTAKSAVVRIALPQADQLVLLPGSERGIGKG